MSGTNARDLAREFGQSRRIRTDIQKPVWRNSLSLPKGETLSPEDWVRVADDYMAELGFDDNHQRVYIVHNKPNQQHLHITASRISLAGRIYLGQNENLKSTKIIHSLEKKYGLTPTPCATTPNPRRTPKKPEIEKSLRTLTKPPRVVIAEIIDRALRTNHPKNEKDLKAALAAQGVEIEFFVKDGETKGITFFQNGLKFSGSALGPDYKFSRIMERMKEQQNDKTSNDTKLADTRRNGPTHPNPQNPERQNQGSGKKDLVARKGRHATKEENKTFQIFLGDKKMEDQQKVVGGLIYRQRTPAPSDPGSLSHGWTEFTDRGGKVWFYPDDEPPRPGNLSGYSWQPPTQTTPSGVCAYDTAINKVGIEQAAKDVVRIAIFKGLPEPVSTHGTDDFRRAVAREMFKFNIELADLDGPAKQEFDKLYKAKFEETEKARLNRVNSISASFSAIDHQATADHRTALARVADQEDQPAKKDGDRDHMRMRGPRQ